VRRCCFDSYTPAPCHPRRMGDKWPCNVTSIRGAVTLLLHTPRDLAIQPAPKERSKARSAGENAFRVDSDSQLTMVTIKLTMALGPESELRQMSLVDIRMVRKVYAARLKCNNFQQR
jgi:hypothetical protein